MTPFPPERPTVPVLRFTRNIAGSAFVPFRDDEEELLMRMSELAANVILTVGPAVLVVVVGVVAMLVKGCG